MLELLSDHRRPTCPHCGMAKLETTDIIDSWESTSENNEPIMVEQTIGSCPNCNHVFDYLQRFSHAPIGFDTIEDITEDEEDEEDDT